MARDISIVKSPILNERNFFICNLAAQYKTSQEIQSLLFEVHNFNMTSQTIRKIIDRNLKTVEKLREKYLSDLMTVPIAQEKIRLERDEELYKLALTIENRKERINSALTCIKEAREETKKSDHSQNFIQFNQFYTLTDDELLEKKRRLEDKILNIKSEVIHDGSLSTK